MTTSSEAGAPSWVSAFLDLAPEEHERGLAFWQGVTGYALSPARGHHHELATLVPPEGDDFLRVQRLGQGTSRVHLDLHVDDVEAVVGHAERLGARVVARPPEGYAVLASPGGVPFCFVRQRASQRPPAARWPWGAGSRVDQVCLDAPAPAYDAECAFWSALTGRPLSDVAGRGEYTRLAPDDRWALQLLLQRLDEDSGPVRAHLDVATDGRPAEVARHERLGAVVEADQPWWTVLRPPAGPAYCLVDRAP